MNWWNVFFQGALFREAFVTHFANEWFNFFMNCWKVRFHPTFEWLFSFMNWCHLFAHTRRCFSVAVLGSYYPFQKSFGHKFYSWMVSFFHELMICVCSWPFLTGNLKIRKKKVKPENEVKSCEILVLGPSYVNNISFSLILKLLLSVHEKKC